MLTKDDYQSALDVQSAADLSAVVFSFADIMHRISDEACAGNTGTEWKNHHPIVRLFAETIAEKSGAEGTGDFGSYQFAYEFCTDAAKGKPAYLKFAVRDNEVVEYEVEGR